MASISTPSLEIFEFLVHFDLVGWFCKYLLFCFFCKLCFFFNLLSYLMFVNELHFLFIYFIVVDFFVGLKFQSFEVTIHYIRSI
jgi:hypothetical protein